jgi:hypothetical protein
MKFNDTLIHVYELWLLRDNIVVGTECILIGIFGHNDGFKIMIRLSKSNDPKS